jgi:hypothetical protein
MRGADSQGGDGERDAARVNRAVRPTCQGNPASRISPVLDAFLPELDGAARQRRRSFCPLIGCQSWQGRLGPSLARSAFVGGKDRRGRASCGRTLFGIWKMRGRAIASSGVGRSPGRYGRRQEKRQIWVIAG